MDKIYQPPSTLYCSLKKSFLMDRKTNPFSTISREDNTFPKSVPSANILRGSQSNKEALRQQCL